MRRRRRIMMMIKEKYQISLCWVNQIHIWTPKKEGEKCHSCRNISTFLLSLMAVKPFVSLRCVNDLASLILLLLFFLYQREFPGKGHVIINQDAFKKTRFSTRSIMSLAIMSSLMVGGRHSSSCSETVGCDQWHWISRVKLVTCLTSSA